MPDPHSMYSCEPDRRHRGPLLAGRDHDGRRPGRAPPSPRARVRPALADAQRVHAGPLRVPDAGGVRGHGIGGDGGRRSPSGRDRGDGARSSLHPRRDRPLGRGVRRYRPDHAPRPTSGRRRDTVHAAPRQPCSILGFPPAASDRRDPGSRRRRRIGAGPRLGLADRRGPASPSSSARRSATCAPVRWRGPSSASAGPTG